MDLQSLIFPLLLLLTTAMAIYLFAYSLRGRKRSVRNTAKTSETNTLEHHYKATITVEPRPSQRKDATAATAEVGRQKVSTPKLSKGSERFETPTKNVLPESHAPTEDADVIRLNTEDIVANDTIPDPPEVDWGAVTAGAQADAKPYAKPTFKPFPGTPEDPECDVQTLRETTAESPMILSSVTLEAPLVIDAVPPLHGLSGVSETDEMALLAPADPNLTPRIEDAHTPNVDAMDDAETGVLQASDLDVLAGFTRPENRTPNVDAEHADDATTSDVITTETPFQED